MAIRALLYSVVDRQVPGGVQVVVERLAKSLRDNGHSVTTAWSEANGAPQDGDWVCPLYVRRAAAQAARPQRPHHLPSVGRLAMGLSRRRPQVVNVHFISEQSLYFLQLRRLFGYKVVLSAHGSDLRQPSDLWRERLPTFLRQADAITVVSQDLAALVASHIGAATGDVHVVPNGVDCDFWSPTGTGPGGDPPMILAVGRLVPVKGYDILLQAFATLRRRGSPAHLTIVGGGHERDGLLSLARQLGVGEALDLPGPLDAVEVRARLRRAAIFVLPSRSEGMPLALLEAMACGIPCVATRVGGVPEVVGSGAGLLVEPDQPDALANALHALLANPAQAADLGQAGWQRAQDFSSAQADAAYERLYRRLLAS